MHRLAILVFVASVAATGCGASTETNLGPPWSLASSSDVGLVDRVLAVWHDSDVAGLREVYTPDALYISIASDRPLDLEGIQTSFPVYEFSRVGGVSLTSEPVAGLWRGLPEGGRYLHCVTRRHGVEYEEVLAVDANDRVVTHYIDAYKPPSDRVHDGYPVFNSFAPVGG
ncbi:MAG TPA: hypothetical protein VNF73_01235 [Candidatus Saccharimonadales bacterium]|nr:hypothetical protein [Candidatus Saccharimonadales bacterium]